MLHSLVPSLCSSFYVACSTEVTYTASYVKTGAERLGTRGEKSITMNIFLLSCEIHCEASFILLVFIMIGMWKSSRFHLGIDPRIDPRISQTAH